MRVAVTGAGGQLGAEIIAAFGDAHEVLALDHDGLDVSDFDEVMQTIGAWPCDAVVNAAAWTDVDGCEADPDRAFAVNALGARNVACAAALSGAFVCHVSTDYVFDGSADSYREWDATGPVSIYGASKLAGETEISAHAPAWAIVRTAWLYGVDGHNFVKTMLRLSGDKETIEVVDDQRGSPTYAADLATVLRELVVRRRRGMYHATNTGSVTWYGFARAIFEEAGLDPERIRPTTAAALGRPAMRPASSVLGGFALGAAGLAAPRPWREALAECIARLGAADAKEGSSGRR